MDSGARLTLNVIAAAIIIIIMKTAFYRRSLIILSLQPPMWLRGRGHKMYNVEYSLLVKWYLVYELLSFE